MIDDLQIIFGPRVRIGEPQNEFFNDPDESYDQSNGLNIHEHQIKFSFKGWLQTFRDMDRARPTAA